MKHEGGGDISLNGFHDEAINRKDSVLGDGDLQNGKYQKKEKKKRKLESGGNKNILDETTTVEEEGNRSLETNACINLESDIEFKPRKDKRKKHEEKRKQNGSVTVSSSVKILENEITGKDEGVKGHRSSEKEDIIKKKNGKNGLLKERRKNGERIMRIVKLRGKEKPKMDSEAKKDNICTRKKGKEVESGFENPKGKRKLKKVRFSDHVEINLCQMFQVLGREKPGKTT
ncbi:unnamed protein product [Ilex paraguariensis]|uniref:Uncharacterized protein n=1 Tax=Ilex paraguariensis TaxID=185542 RepID=A0ABC8S9D6_9AQUA